MQGFLGHVVFATYSDFARLCSFDAAVDVTNAFWGCSLDAPGGATDAPSETVRVCVGFIQN